MGWNNKRLHLLMLALLLWGHANGFGVWNKQAAQHWQVSSVTVPLDQSKSSSQQNIITASGVQASESVSGRTEGPSSLKPVYRSSGFFQTDRDPKKSVFLSWHSVPGTSSSYVPSSNVQMGSSSPVSSQYVASGREEPVKAVHGQYVTSNDQMRQYTYHTQAARMPQTSGPSNAWSSRYESMPLDSQSPADWHAQPFSPSQHASVSPSRQTVNKPLPQAPMNLRDFAAQNQGSFRPQFQQSSSSTFSGCANAPLFQLQRHAGQQAHVAVAQTTFKPTSQASSDPAIVTQGQASYGAPLMGSSRSTSSRLLLRVQGTSQNAVTTLSRVAYRPTSPPQASSNAAISSRNQGEYERHLTGSSWPTTSGNVGSQLISRGATNQYGSGTVARVSVPSSSYYLSNFTVISRAQKPAARFTSSSGSMPSRTPGTSQHYVPMVNTAYNPTSSQHMSQSIVSVDQGHQGAQSTSSNWPAAASGHITTQFSQGTSNQSAPRFVAQTNVLRFPSHESSGPSVVIQGQGSYGLQSTRSNWPTRGRLNVQLPSQGQAPGNLPQTSHTSRDSSTASLAQSFAAHARGSNWQTSLGRVVSNLPSQGAAPGMLSQTTYQPVNSYHASSLSPLASVGPGRYGTWSIVSSKPIIATSSLSSESGRRPSQSLPGALAQITIRPTSPTKVPQELGTSQAQSQLMTDASGVSTAYGAQSSSLPSSSQHQSFYLTSQAMPSFTSQGLSRRPSISWTNYGSQTSGHAIRYRVPSDPLDKNLVPLDSQVTSSNSPSAPLAYSRLASVLHTGSVSSAPMAQMTKMRSDASATHLSKRL